jgi:hypothetical protein
MSEIFETPYGWLSRQEARAILCEAQNHRCCYCGGVMVDPCPGPVFVPQAASIEHIVAKARGGDNGWDNIVAACQSCNSGRGLMHAIAWFYKLTSTGCQPPSLAVREADQRTAEHRQFADWRARQRWLDEIKEELAALRRPKAPPRPERASASWPSALRAIAVTKAHGRPIDSDFDHRQSRIPRVQGRR